MNLELWQSRFRDDMELSRWSENTIKIYVMELRPFFEFLAAQGIDDLAGISRDVIEGYRTHLFYATYRNRPISAARQANRLSAVKRFTRFLTQARFLLADPSLAVELPRVPIKLPRILASEKQVVRLLEAPDVTTLNGVRDRAILELLYSSGIRNSELRELQLEDIELEGRQVFVRCGKGGKSRVVPIGDEAAVWIGEYAHRARPYMVRRLGDNTLFLTSRGLAFTRPVLAKLVRTWAEAVGLGRNLTPHALRHCCASHMLRHGASVRHVQEMLGHASLMTTERYLHVEISDLRRVHQRCHPRERRMHE